MQNGMWICGVMLAALAGRTDAQMFWAQQSPTPRPGARHSHGMAYEAGRGRVLLFGGDGFFGSVRDDTWEWNGAGWTERLPGTRPPGRAGHGMSYDLGRGVVVMFGGYDGSPNPRGDTWEWNGAAWTQRFPRNSPSPRRDTALCYDAARRRTLLFGGSNGTTELADTWEWDGTDWLRRRPAASPSPRSGHGLAFDAGRRVLVLFGGSDDQTWEWDGANWSRRMTATSPPSTSAKSLLYDVLRQRIVLHVPWTSPDPTTWEFDGRDWRLMLAGGAMPPRRDSITAAYDVARGRAVAFGGWHFHSATVYDDTWLYGPTTRPGVVQVGAGCPGTAGIPLAAAMGPPIVGNRDFAVQIAPAPPNAAVVLAVSARPAQTLVSGGCVVYLAPPLQSVLAVVPSTGTARVPVPLPPSRSLAGLVFHGQGAVADPGGAYLGVAAFTQGLTIRIGD